MSEPEPPSDRPAAAEEAQFPPPEWGKERSPVVDRVIAVAAVAGCVLAAAGLAVWGFALLDADEDTSGATRANTTHEAGATPVTTPSPTPRRANEADVGDCVKVVRGGMDAELEVVDCGAPDAGYRVAIELEMQEKCPAGSYLAYSVIGAGGWSLCLTLNAAVGRCYNDSVTEGLTLAECTAADFEVVAVLTGRADENACPPPPPNVLFHPEPLVYPEPPLTVCLTSIPN